MRKNITNIIFTAIVSIAIVFGSCSTNDPYDRVKHVGEWTTGVPEGKLSIAVDEDNYNSLLGSSSQIPSATVSIKKSGERCFLNISNQEFADYIYVPQNFDLASGDSYYYATVTPAQLPIVAKGTIVLNESFPLVTNIAYNFLNDYLKKVDMRSYVSQIEPMLIGFANEQIMKYIDQEGGIAIEQLNVTLKHKKGETLKEYLAQLGMLDVFVVKIIKNLSGDKKTEIDALINKELSKAVEDLLPILVSNAKSLSINDFQELLTEDLGDLKDVVKGMITPLLEEYVPAEIMNKPLGVVLDNLISGVEYIQKNLKTALVIDEFTIMPTSSTISLKKIRTDGENSTVLVNNINFAFVDLKLLVVKENKNNDQEFAVYNTILVPILNTALPKLLSNAGKLPGDIGRTLEAANDFNYIISTPLTKK